MEDEGQWRTGEQMEDVDQWRVWDGTMGRGVVLDIKYLGLWCVHQGPLPPPPPPPPPPPLTSLTCEHTPHLGVGLGHVGRVVRADAAGRAEAELPLPGLERVPATHTCPKAMIVYY